MIPLHAGRAHQLLALLQSQLALRAAKDEVPIFEKLMALHQDIPLPMFANFHTQQLKYWYDINATWSISVVIGLVCSGVTSEGYGFLDTHKLHRIYQLLSEPPSQGSSESNEPLADTVSS